MGESAAPGAGMARSRTTASELVQALYAPWVLHTGLTTESAYGGQMGKVIAFALEAAGAPVVKGGAGQAVNAFRAAYRGKWRGVARQCRR
jgi:phytoene dehydrogenase-like protein